MKTYEIQATYRVDKILEVTVREGDDPMNPKNWVEIVSEYDNDCLLDDVKSAEEV